MSGAAKPPIGWSGCATALKALADRVLKLEAVAHPPIDLTAAMDELLDARGYVATRPSPPDANGIAWRPMASVKDVRDGRPILMRFEGDPPEGLLILFGAAICHWLDNDNEWFAATSAWSLTCGSGGWIDDHFTAWAPLPDISSAEIERLATTSKEPADA